MKNLKIFLGVLATSAGLAGCGATDDWQQPPSQPGAAQRTQALSTSYRLGMTWRVLQQNGQYVLVGSDAQSNAYLGDTSIDTFLPVLCLKQDGRAAPTGITFGFSSGWTGGEAKLTPPIAGSVLTSVDLANTLCAEQFGAGYQMAEFHAGGGGWGWWAQGTLGTTSRFWVAINDQPANPWNSVGEVPPPPAPPKFFENENAIPGRFIVLFPETTAPGSVASLAQTLVATYGGSVETVYSTALMGFVLLGSDAQARAMSNDSRVESIDQDSQVAAQTTQLNPPWGLDRVDQRPLSRDNQYTYDNTGAGVNAYVLDTGVRRTHLEFGGRVTQSVDFILVNGPGDDCNGHGTAVASAIGGQSTGIAKGVNIISLRIANCGGTASNSTLAAGLDWVARHHVKPAVANLSYGGPPGFWRRWFGWKAPTDRAVARTIAAGVTVVVSAGNEKKDVERASPARLPEAITVAASTSSDQRSDFSNWGRGVDLFAPGTGIQVAGIGSDTVLVTMNGTSFSAPFVAGAAALYLKDHPYASPAEVATALINNATPGAISDTRGAPNRLLHTRFSGPTDEVGVISATNKCPDVFKTVTLHMDNEDSRDSSWISGWVGATSVDSGGNTDFTFCRTSGSQFRSLSSSNDARANYAVLKLGATCPAGSVEFTRHFDNEDRATSNSYTGNISPNVVDGNTTLYFCLFKGGGTIASSLPALGYDYGVFAAPQFVFTSAKGTIHTDDEDSNNANWYSADPAWKSAATAIVSEGGNTDLRTARAAFPTCGDRVCNGLETDWTCPVDCSVCGDGTCGPDESVSTCAYDCGSCGDGVCGYGESAYSCGSDCGYCGDGICGGGEMGYCTSDCGGCTSVSSGSESSLLRPPPCEEPSY
ncbi:S8 family serine peptidase [Myxococcaceae bacterium GXIMD 01537]